jgi:hypothetical protein
LSGNLAAAKQFRAARTFRWAVAYKRLDDAALKRLLRSLKLVRKDVFALSQRSDYLISLHGRLQWKAHFEKDDAH